MIRRSDSGQPAAQEFVSEPIDVAGGALDIAAMGRGEPGLPAAFRWRGEVRAVRTILHRWKFTSAEGGHAKGEVYLRRHYYRVCMDDGSEWVVYFVRQTPRSGSPRRRWFLYERRSGSAPADA